MDCTPTPTLTGGLSMKIVHQCTDEKCGWVLPVMMRQPFIYISPFTTSLSRVTQLSRGSQQHHNCETTITATASNTMTTSRRSVGENADDCRTHSSEDCFWGDPATGEPVVAETALGGGALVPGGTVKRATTGGRFSHQRGLHRAYELSAGHTCIA